jgi:Uma2 family endonuclease
MSVAVSTTPNGSPLPTLLLRRFTVEEYHRMIEAGILTEDEPLELLEGWIVIKMPRTPERDLALEKTDHAIRSRLPTGWRLRIQCAVTLPESEPEPDIALVRGPIPSATGTHPAPDEIGMLVEVSESSLENDRSVKGPSYARASISVYWIVNLRERQVEVYTDPTGPAARPRYRTRRDYVEADSVPLVLEGREVGLIAVVDLLP